MLGGASSGPRRTACRYGFGQSRRLSKSAEFERLLREGTRRSMDGYTFFIARRTEGAPRLGVLVSRKHASRSTERNRIKRCIREAFRLEQHALGAIDVLVRPPYGSVRVKRDAEMIARLRLLFLKLDQ